MDTDKSCEHFKDQYVLPYGFWCIECVQKLENKYKEFTAYSLIDRTNLMNELFNEEIEEVQDVCKEEVEQITEKLLNAKYALQVSIDENTQFKIANNTLAKTSREVGDQLYIAQNMNKVKDKEISRLVDEVDRLSGADALVDAMDTIREQDLHIADLQEHNAFIDNEITNLEYQIEKLLNDRK